MLIAERDGHDAFVIGHLQKPALREVRAALRISVIGLGGLSMRYACMPGGPIALVTINPIFLPYREDRIVSGLAIAKQMARTGIELQRTCGAEASRRSTPAHPPAIHPTRRSESSSRSPDAAPRGREVRC